MSRDRRALRRRTLLAGAAGLATATAGCARTGQRGGTGDPPVVDEGSSEDRSVRVELTVVDGDGRVDGEPVALIDASGDDRRVAETGPGGRLVFVEDVGPPPCNTLGVELPERGRTERIGCLDGGTTVSKTIEVGGGSDETTDGQDDEVDDRSVRVELRVVDGERAVADERVLLRDRSGGDRQDGRTDADGRVSFVEDVGPPPCNSLSARLPDRGETVDLGCHNGGKTITETVEVGDDDGDGVDDRSVRVELRVVDGGEPTADERVLLRDRSGADRQTGRTDADGRVSFVEDVGPPPCNSLFARLPDRDLQVSLGCHNGGKTVSETVDVADDPRSRSRSRP